MPKVAPPPRAKFVPPAMTKKARVAYLAAVCLGSCLLIYGGESGLNLLGALIVGACLGVVLGRNLRT
jgi:hypothetical protein